MNIRAGARAVGFVLSTALLLAGCFSSTSGQLLIPKEVADRSVYYVEQSPSDSRNLAATIADRMRARNLDATSGPVLPEHIDYKVTYVDKWMWDMRMYLMDLRIELRDPKDNSIVGYGDSNQSSLKAMGKTFGDIIDAALNELFKQR